MFIIQSIQNPQLVNLLRKGAVGVLPTDTVYGLVCSAQDEQAVGRLYALKSRERKPGTVIAGSVEQLKAWGLRAEDLARVSRFWPGAVSVVLEHDISFLHQGIGDQPFRIPADADVRSLLEQTGPLLTTSANLPGEPPATNLAEAQAYFGDTVDFYVDGGLTANRQPSTIISLDHDNQIHVIRQGAVAILDEEGGD